MSKKNFILLFLVALCFVFREQASGQTTIKLKVDSAGKLMKFPYRVVKPSRKLRIRAVVPEAFIFNQVDEMDSLLRRTYAYLTRNNVKEQYFQFFCRSDSFHFLPYLKDLNTDIRVLENSNDIYQFAKSGKIPSSISNNPYLPTASFLQHVIATQFRVVVQYAGTDTIYLDKFEYNEKEHCFYFYHSQVFKIKDALCTSCYQPNPDQFTLQILRGDPVSQTFKDWFERRNKQLAERGVYATKAALLNYGDTSTPTRKTVYTQLKKPTLLQDWLPYWFWFNEGRLTIDPLFDADYDARKVSLLAVTEHLATITRRADTLKQKKKFIDSVLARVTYNINFIDTFTSTQALISKLGDTLTLLNDSIKLLTTQRNKLQTNTPRWQDDKYLNKVMFPLSINRQIKPLSQYDAMNSFRRIPLSRKRLNKVLEIPENEVGYLLIHNTDASIDIKSNQQRVAFKDNEEFTEWVSEQLSQMSAVDLSSSLIGNVQNQVAALIKFKTPKLTGATFADIKCDSTLIPGKVVDDQIKTIADSLIKRAIQFGYERLPFGPMPTTPQLRTEVIRSRFTDEAPFTDSIAVNMVKGTLDTTVIQTKFKVGKLRFIRVGAGIAVNQNPVITNTIDTAGNSFRMSSKDNSARSLLGIKVYPFQSYARDRWLIPRYPLHRLSVFGGFEMLHPLDNFYFGGCYDIVPGLGFSVGANAYLRTTNKIENNQVTDTYKGYKVSGAYYAVVVDPVLFVQFVKLFFK